MAEAVAAEMAKVYAHEHLPAPNRVFNHMPDPDELDALLVILPGLVTSDSISSMSAECLLNLGHFLKCHKTLYSNSGSVPFLDHLSGL